MTKIFVCYRRDDSADTTERIVEHLTEISGKFSAGDIFFDVESIPVGVNFRTYIDERVAQCVVMLVVIGPDWAAITNARGDKRLHDPRDQVRIEVESALKRGIPLIPVLVRGADMPFADDLPDTIRDVVDFNGLPIRRAPDFKNDMMRLIEALERVVRGAAKPATPQVDVTPFVALCTLRKHTASVSACAFSPDGRQIASASDDRTLKLWDASSGIHLYALRENTSFLGTKCVFSPDGLYLVASNGGGLNLWDVRSGQQLREFGWSTNTDSDLLTDSDPFDELFGDTFRKPDLTEVRPPSFGGLSGGKRLKIGHKGDVISCAFSPDGHYVVSASMDNTLILWETDSGLIIHTLKGHSDQVRGCGFSPDGYYLISASYDNTLKLWETASGSEIRTLSGHKFSVLACAFSPDGKLVASSSWDNILKLWATETGRELRTLTGHLGPVLGCAFSPDGQYIVSASRDSTLKLWEVASGRELYTLTGHAAAVNACDFSPDGQYIVSASDDRTLIIWGMPGT